jgi:Leucine carboxyl methyltransferase
MIPTLWTHALFSVDAFIQTIGTHRLRRKMKVIRCLLSVFLCVKAEAFAGSAELSRSSNTHRTMVPLPTDNLNRGDTYGASKNSTILAARDAAAAVGVKPPDDAHAKKWKLAYTLQKYATPILHLIDRQKPPNSSLNLYCIWWKALSGNDKESPVYDHSLSFDLLPWGTRSIVRRPRFFPRLHHANVEIRTAFLDRAVTRCADQHRKDKTKIRLVSLGAGYDVRSIKMKERGVVDKAFELDLLDVVEAKRKILKSKRFQRRRPHTARDSLPTAFPVDLNDLEKVKATLNEILQEPGDWHTIFLFEAVMIYLDEGVPRALLQLCGEVLKSTASRGSLCFADRLENVPGGDQEIALQELASTGWNLVEWLPKPGLARHMGRAEQL